MHPPIGRQITRLQRLTISQLRSRYAAVFGEPFVFRRWQRAIGGQRRQVLVELGPAVRRRQGHGDGGRLQHEAIPGRRRRHDEAGRVVRRRAEEGCRPGRPAIFISRVSSMVGWP